MKKLHAVSIGAKVVPNALVHDENRVLQKVVRKTGFIVEKEIARGKMGYVKGNSVTRSIIYKGSYVGKPAVLKLEGLMLETPEAKMIERFERQNKSKLIHTPVIYLSEDWSKKKGYGFLIEEYVDAPLIYDLPFATPKQMKGFAKFYQEYRTKCITRPWLENEPGRLHASAVSKSSGLLAAEITSIEKWRSSSDAKGRIEFDDYAPYLVRFYPLAAKYIPNIKLEFMHGQLIAKDILRLSDGTYKIFSNIFWRYSMQWYDLAKNLWWDLLQIHSNSCTLPEVVAYLDKWLEVYKTIPLVKKDPDFDEKIRFLLLERLIGIMVGDMGSGDYWGSEEGKKYFKHMLGIYQGLFDHFADELRNRSRS